MKTVRILGNAANLAEMPPPDTGVETWCCNQKHGYSKWLPRVWLDGEWTRWINLHSREHMLKTYPRDFKWLAEQTKPIYFQKVQPDVPASRPFPRKEIQNFFKTRYFTCSGAWLMAWASMENFKKIELWGFEISKRKPAYSWERPCMFYWILEARRRGIEVWHWPGLDWDFSEAGDPASYTGPLYGFGTKSEIDWNIELEDFV